MTTEQTVNLCGSVLALAGSLGFGLAYTLFASWRRSSVGRLLVTEALVIAGFMTVSILAYAVDPGSGSHLGALLIARGILAAGFGAMMVYQAWLVSYTQVKAASRDTGDVRR